LAPNFFWREGIPEFLDLDHKIKLTSDNVAMFHGDRPMELGDLALKKERKKETAEQHNYHSRRPKNLQD